MEHSIMVGRENVTICVIRPVRLRSRALLAWSVGFVYRVHTHTPCPMPVTHPATLRKPSGLPPEGFRVHGPKTEQKEGVFRAVKKISSAALRRPESSGIYDAQWPERLTVALGEREKQRT